jgi:hypothetical protein
MGLEAQCTARSAGRSSIGKAHLESDRLTFRGGDLRLDIPFTEIRSLRASDGALYIASAEVEATFDLGPAAAKWEEKIRNPRSLLDKLRVKAGMRVALIGFDDPGFRDQIEAKGAEMIQGGKAKELDLLFLAAGRKPVLKKVSGLAKSLKPDGALWIIFPKGVKEITASEVRDAGLAAGLVDVKVVSFSTAETGLKFVIPLKRRKR